MKLLRLLVVAAAAALVTAAPARAQMAAASLTSGAPVAAHLSVGVQKRERAPTPTGGTKAPRADTKQNRAMMIVGGAAMLTGAVVGSDAGTLISVGGAVVFLWGLYQYLQ